MNPCRTLSIFILDELSFRHPAGHFGSAPRASVGENLRQPPHCIPRTRQALRLPDWGGALSKEPVLLHINAECDQSDGTIVYQNIACAPAQPNQLRTREDTSVRGQRHDPISG